MSANDRDANPPPGPYRLHPYRSTFPSHKNNVRVFKLRDRNHFFHRSTPIRTWRWVPCEERRIEESFCRNSARKNLPVTLSMKKIKTHIAHYNELLQKISVLLVVLLQSRRTSGHEWRPRPCGENPRQGGQARHPRRAHIQFNASSTLRCSALLHTSHPRIPTYTKYNHIKKLRGASSSVVD